MSEPNVICRGAAIACPPPVPGAGINGGAFSGVEIWTIADNDRVMEPGKFHFLASGLGAFNAKLPSALANLGKRITAFIDGGSAPTTPPSAPMTVSLEVATDAILSGWNPTPVPANPMHVFAFPSRGRDAGQYDFIAVDLTAFGAGPIWVVSCKSLSRFTQAFKAPPKYSIDTDLPACSLDSQGAILTADANGAFPGFDGQPPVDEYDGAYGLVINQTNASHNGAWFLVQIGDAGSPWILERVGGVSDQPEDSGFFSFVADGQNKGKVYGGAPDSEFIRQLDAVFPDLDSEHGTQFAREHLFHTDAGAGGWQSIYSYTPSQDNIGLLFQLAVLYQRGAAGFFAGHYKAEILAKRIAGVTSIVNLCAQCDFDENAESTAQVVVVGNDLVLQVGSKAGVTTQYVARIGIYETKNV